MEKETPGDRGDGDASKVEKRRKRPISAVSSRTARRRKEELEPGPSSTVRRRLASAPDSPRHRSPESGQEDSATELLMEFANLSGSVSCDKSASTVSATVSASSTVEEQGDIHSSDGSVNLAAEQAQTYSDTFDKIFGCGQLHYYCEDCLGCKCFNDCSVCVHKDEGECQHCRRCITDCYSDVGSSSDEEQKESDDEEIQTPQNARNAAILQDFTEISSDNNLSQQAITAFCKFFRKWDFGDFPKCAQTLMKTPQETPVRSVPPGIYHHCGLTKRVKEYASETKCSKVDISVNIDGLPLANSSSGSLWPILCSFNDSKVVQLVGVYYGKEKPKDSNDFLAEFLCELKVLCSEGVTVNGNDVAVKLNALICDAPAKSFVLKFKSHNGFYGCPKCDVKGKKEENRMTFLDIGSLRTDEDFRSQTQREHHVGLTMSEMITVAGFGPVTNTVIDYMHCCLLGTMRKILYMWVQGPFSVRHGARTINEISEELCKLSPFIPKEFARVPRSLQFVKRFKATELRLIFFYLFFVFYKKLREDVYEHFLCLHVALSLLANPVLCFEYNDYAGELLNYWVTTFKTLYGREFVSYNIHCLQHLSSDVAKYGCLDNFSAFKFENYLQKIKNLVKPGKAPLQQLIRRLSEKSDVTSKREQIIMVSESKKFKGRHEFGPLLPGCASPQYSSFLFRGFLLSTSEANNCCKLADGSIVVVQNFAYSSELNTMCVLGKKFLNVKNIYEKPCPSSVLGIFYVYGLSSDLLKWPTEDVAQKMVRLPFKRGFAVVPMLHGHN